MNPAEPGALVVFAKEPVPGRVKTRMVPPFTPREAAEFYAEMLRDVLATTTRIAAQLGLVPVLAVHPPEAIRCMARDAPNQMRVVPQRGANLSERMEWAVREAAATGAQRILLRSSDSPVLDREKVGAALTLLDDFDLVVCPDRGGGYNLIGLRRPIPRLFDHPMSTRTVLDDTLANAAALGLRAHVQQPSFDLDTAADLRWLADARAGECAAAVTKLCPNTLAYLDAKALWDHPEPD